MGVNFFLFRVRSPIGPGGVSTDRVRELTEGLTFGTPQEVKRRLREANVFGMGTGSPDEPDRTDFTSLSTLLAGKAPFVDPRTGEPLPMPKDEGATFTTDDGRLVNISLSGDTVEHITFYKSSPRDVIDVVAALEDTGILVRVPPDVLFRREDYDYMVASIRQMITSQGPVSAAQVRDRFNTSRRYVLALLEYLDSTGVTVREGDLRRLK